MPLKSATVEERIIIFLLRLGGAVTCTAFAAMVMPTEWMVATHAWLGLGAFPVTPVTDYLTRSISGLYGFHGVLLFLIASDVRRFRPFVSYVGAMNLLFGVCVLLIDLHAGLPWFWTLSEGPSLVAMGVAILWLRKGIGKVPG